MGSWCDHASPQGVYTRRGVHGAVEVSHSPEDQNTLFLSENSSSVLTTPPRQNQHRFHTYLVRVSLWDFILIKSFNNLLSCIPHVIFSVTVRLGKALTGENDHSPGRVAE